MKVKEVKDVGRQWVSEEASKVARFYGAFFIKTSLGDSPSHGGEEKRQGDSLAIVVQMY
jgi:hypothetical protein